MIGGFLSVLFVSCFKGRCFVIYNRLDKFASQIFRIFLILVTCKNKATSASFLRQKIHSPSRFPSLLLSSLESFSAELGDRACYPDCDLHTPPFTKMIDGTDKPKIPSMFAKGTAQYNEFRYNISKIKLPNFKVICLKRATI